MLYIPFLYYLHVWYIKSLHMRFNIYNVQSMLMKMDADGMKNHVNILQQMVNSNEVSACMIIT